MKRGDTGNASFYSPSPCTQGEGSYLHSEIAPHPILRKLPEDRERGKEAILHWRNIFGWVALATALMPLAWARGDNAAATPRLPANRAVLIQLNGEINDYSRDQLEQRIDQVRGLGAKTIIL